MKLTKTIPYLLAFALASTNLSAKEPVGLIAPAAKAILDKSLEASGGMEALKKIKSRKTIGNMSMPAQGINMTMTSFHKTPTHFYTKMEIPNMMTIEQGFDGETAWSKDSMQGLRKLQGAELQQTKDSAAMFPELAILENLQAAMVHPEVTEDGKTLQVIKVTSKDKTERTLFFDKETNLLHKMRMEVVSGPGGKMTTDVVMADYEEKDGIKFATTMKTSAMGQNIEMKLTEVEHNIEIEDAKFSMPKE